MKYELWHKDSPTFRNNNPRELQLDFPKGFTLVAILDCYDEHSIYTLTNHMNHPWTENPEVVALPTGNQLRSTSVGDVYVAVDTRESWTVDGIGLTQFEEAR